MNKYLEKPKYHILMAMLTYLVICLVAFSCQAGEVDTSRAVIHHTASHDVSASTIDQWHKARGWDGIGYHYVIRSNGDIETGRDITKQGAHAKRRNNYVGIALTGYDTFTPEQVEALKVLLKTLEVSRIERHHEECPGVGLDIEKIRGKL